MMKYFYTIATIFFLISVEAQECGTDAIHEQLMASDPSYAAMIEALETQVQNRIGEQSDNRLDEIVYHIPIVVHVIHTGEPIGTGTNISDSQIHNAIEGMNYRFRNMNGLGVDVGIEFCLTNVDLGGNPTTGIVRINAANVSGYPEYGIEYPSTICPGAPSDPEIKGLSQWPGSFYNIWVVNKICSTTSIAAYARYPSNLVDYGMVIRYNYFTETSQTPSHELGHGLFLYHTFEGDNNGASCPTNINCNVAGDKVCDTPPHKRADCVTNTCSSEINFVNSNRNFMSYCATRNRFTQNQKDRMRAIAIGLPMTSTTACSVLATDKMSRQLPFSIFPNPAETEFTIAFEGMDATATTVEIYNLHGQIIHREDVTSNPVKVNISHLSQGIYIVKLKSGNRYFTQKLTIK